VPKHSQTLVNIHEHYQTKMDMLCTTLYELLLLEVGEDRTIDLVQAKKNYRKILKVIHTDKNDHYLAKLASQSVIKAWEILSDEETYEYYGLYGREGITESIDWIELQNAAIFIREIFKGKGTKEAPQAPTREKPEENDDEIEIIDLSEEETEEGNQQQQSQESEQLNQSQEDNAQTEQESQQQSPSQETEMEQENDPPEENGKRRQSYRREIKEILEHKKRRGELKFRVQWDIPNLQPIWEKKETLIKEHENKLIEYLLKLQEKRIVSFRSLIRSNDDLGELLAKLK